MNTKDVRKKLASIGVTALQTVSLLHVRGDTFLLLCTETGHPEIIARTIRAAGYFAELQRDVHFQDTPHYLFINLNGTEGADGMIPENVADVPLRPSITQMPMFDEDGAK